MSPTHLIIGCGYLGRVVAERWLAAGHRVAALTRGRADELQSLGVEPIVGDVTEAATLHLPPVTTVLYAVGLDRSAGRPMRDVYVGGLTNVLAALPRPAHVLYVSSTSVYGQTDGSLVDESSPTEPMEENGQIVLECERLLRETLPSAIVLRFAGIYGPGRVIRRTAIEAGEPLASDPDHWLNLIHVADGARAVAAAADRGAPGATYNVADDTPVRRGDFYTAMAELLAAPPARFVPPPPGAAAPPHERANRRVSNRRLRAELGIELLYPDYRAGLRQAVGQSFDAPAGLS